MLSAHSFESDLLIESPTLDQTIAGYAPSNVLCLVGGAPCPDFGSRSIIGDFDSRLLISKLRTNAEGPTFVWKLEIGREADYALSLVYPELRFAKREIGSGPKRLIPSMLCLLRRALTSEVFDI